MIGEIEQMSSIVISARKALHDRTDIEFVPGKYVLSIKFIFASRPISHKVDQAQSVGEWFDICRKRGLKDIKFSVSATDQLNMLGFSGFRRGTIICFWRRGKVSCFYPEVEYNEYRKGWEIVYIELDQITVNRDKLIFTDRSGEFMEVLSDIGKFAAEIDQPTFSNAFHKAYEALLNPESSEVDAPKQLPGGFRGIYRAIVLSDVFGAMGSWNDSPWSIAVDMGRAEEYKSLSLRLLEQINYQLMYVTNECWKKR